MDPTDPLSDVSGAYERLTESELDNLGIVLGAYRSFRGARRKHLAYVSMPITSGKRLYDVLTANGVTSIPDLAAKRGLDALWELVIKPNIQEGIGTADRLGIVRNDLLFIAPSVFEAKKWRWTQDAYMSLWYRVLGEMAGAHYLMDGWEYSTGGVLEVMFSLFMRWRMIRPNTEKVAVEQFGIKNFLTDMPREERMREYEAMWNIRIYDAAGQELLIDQILAKIVAAIEDLQARGLPYKDLIGPAWKIKATPIMSPCPAGGMEGCPPNAMTETFLTAADRIEAIVRSS